MSHTVCSCSKFPREPKLKEYISELTAEVVGPQSDSVPEEGSAPQDTSARQIKKGLCLFCYRHYSNTIVSRKYAPPHA